MESAIESGDRLYRAKAYAHFSAGIGETVMTLLDMKGYDNEFMQIRIKRLSPDASVPHYAHGPAEDAGMDLRAITTVTLEPNVPQAVSTGIAIEVPPGYEAQVRPRSGLAL